MKHLLVGSRLGRMANGARGLLTLAAAPRCELGTIANDLLAERLVTRLCAESKVFVDVGAHIGSIIAEVALRCPGATIVAFEAIPEKVARLKAKFPNVTIHNCAVFEREGETSFFINPKQSGYSSLADSGSGMREIRVVMRRLDDVLPQADVDVMKIDVEGAELGVLRGGEALFARCRPVVMFESAPGDVLGYTKEQMFDWLAERDFGIFAPNRLAHTAPPMRLDCFLDSHEYPRRTTNFFAVPLERVEEIRAKARRIV